ncbi:MAG: transglutaminase domain-containing protein [Bacteroidota bacterium]
MKRLLFIVFLLVMVPAAAQDDVTSLALKLTRDEQTDQQKVTAIFRWITNNISYTVFSKHKKSKNKFIYAEPDDDGPLKPLNERVAEMVLKRRTAFCDGYARLFAALCEKAGIKSEIICGYANSGFGRGPAKFGVNHYWNAVYLDNKWQLLDATWASGYIDMRSGEYVSDYNDRYFLSSPEFFIRDHYPDDPRWTLLPDAKIPDEFRHSPFRHKSFAKYGFTSFFPGRGIIDASVGDTIVLQLETGRLESNPISPSMLVDSAFFSHSSSWVFLQPDTAELAPMKKQYSFRVSSDEVKWLYLLYNDDVVLRYRLNITARKNQPGDVSVR